MGGKGSGRKPSVETIIKKTGPDQTPVGDSIIIPDYSGIQKAALKISPSISTTGHTIQDEGSGVTQRTNLNFSGSGVQVVDDVSNDASVVNVTTSTGAGLGDDVYFGTLSGSAVYSGATAVSVDGHTHATGDVTSGTFADARISESSVTQHEAAINHDNLTGFVANEHIDWTSTSSNLTTSGVASAKLISGSGIVTTGAISGSSLSVDNNISGANLWVDNTISGSQARLSGDNTVSGTSYVPMVLFGTTSGSHTASDYPRGSVLFIHA